MGMTNYETAPAILDNDDWQGRIVAPPKGAVASRNGRIAPRGCLIKEVER